MIMVTDWEQNSPEWDAARVGNPGASEFSRIITTTGQRSKQREKFLWTMAGEIMTGRKASSYSNYAMQRGHENESAARNDYATIYGVDIVQVGMCYRDERKMYHCSPDGLVPDLNIGFETKDAQPDIQVERILNGPQAFEKEHYTQVQGNLFVTGYDAWDLQSYCVGWRPNPAFVVRVYPDMKFHEILEAELERFCLDLAVLVKKLKESNR